MSILIELTRPDIQCLRVDLPQGSDLREILFSNPIVCNEIDARRLLRIAEENCSPAMRKIQEGIRLSGLKSS